MANRPSPSRRMTTLTPADPCLARSSRDCVRWSDRIWVRSSPAGHVRSRTERGTRTSGAGGPQTNASQARRAYVSRRRATDDRPAAALRQECSCDLVGVHPGSDLLGFVGSALSISRADPTRSSSSVRRAGAGAATRWANSRSPGRSCPGTRSPRMPAARRRWLRLE